MKCIQNSEQGTSAFQYTNLIHAHTTTCVMDVLPQKQYS